MKIIDDKGRLWVFGWRINIIDFFVIIFILGLTPMFYYGWKVAHKPIEPIPPKQPSEAEILSKQNEGLKIEIKDLLKDNLQWQKKYNEEIARREEIFEEHKRLRKYYK